MQTAVEVARWRLLPGKPYRKMERLIKWSWMNALTQQKRKKVKKDTKGSNTYDDCKLKFIYPERIGQLNCR